MSSETAYTAGGALPEATAASACPPVPLCRLRTGDRARVHTAELSAHDFELLRAMGLCEDCELRVCRSGAPCIVQVNATRLALSPTVTRRILVAPATKPLAS